MMLTRKIIWITLQAGLVCHAGCMTPVLRATEHGESVIQGESGVQQEYQALSDLETRSENFTITGTSTQRQFPITLQPGSVSFQQVPVPGFSTSSSFRQVEVPVSWSVVDILLQIDNSPSMASEQQKLAANFSTFLSKIENLDWRIAVATTDPREYGMIRGMIRKGQFATPADEMAAFQSLISVGVSSDIEATNERQLSNMIGILLANPQNFIRSNAAFIGIFVSDEDSCSSGYNNIDPYNGPKRQGTPPARCRDDWDTPNALIEVGVQIKGALNAFGFYGIIWVPGTPSGGTGTLHEGYLLQETINKTNKFSRSIWNTDYAQVLSDIGADIPDPRDRRFTLPNTPNQTGLQVFVNNQLVNPTFYRVEGNQIIFDVNHIPPSLANIRIDYSVGTPPITSYVLPDPIVNSSLEVFVNGARMNNFTYDEGLRKIVFQAIPPANARIEIDYTKFPVNPTRQFDIGEANIALDSLQVRMGQILLMSNQYRREGSRVILDSSITPLENLTMTFIPQSSLSTRFVLAALPYGSTLLLSSGSFDAQQNAIILNPGQLRQGQLIVAQYSTRVRDTRRFTLTTRIFEETLRVYVNEQEVSSSDYELKDGLTVVFKSSLPPTARVSFFYAEYQDLPQSFVLSSRLEDSAVHRVEINREVVDPSLWTYDAPSRTLSFTFTPKALSMIQVFFD